MADSLIVPCSACSTLNRVPRSRIQDVPVCRDCRNRLFGGAPAELTSATFDRFVGKSDLPIVVDFWAAWCGPCKIMAPQFAQASEELAGTALLAKVDSDNSPEVSGRFQISSIPTMVMLDHGREVARTSGAMQAGQIVAWVRGQL